MSLAGTGRDRTRVLTVKQLRRAESNGWRVTEFIAQNNGLTYVNLVGRSGRVRTVRIVTEREARG